jgi:hypothetical protein
VYICRKSLPIHDRMSHAKSVLWYEISLISGFFITLTGVIIKIQHWPLTSIVLTAGIFISLIFVFIALTNIYVSTRSATFKFCWLAAFILTPWIAGAIYYYVNINSDKQTEHDSQHQSSRRCSRS